MENKYFKICEQLQDYIFINIEKFNELNVDFSENFMKELNEEIIEIEYEYSERNLYKLYEINNQINSYLDSIIIENLIEDFDFEEIDFFAENNLEI